MTLFILFEKAVFMLRTCMVRFYRIWKARLNSYCSILPFAVLPFVIETNCMEWREVSNSFFVDIIHAVFMLILPLRNGLIQSISRIHCSKIWLDKREQSGRLFCDVLVLSLLNMWRFIRVISCCCKLFVMTIELSWSVNHRDIMW